MTDLTTTIVALHREALLQRIETLKASSAAARQGTRVDGDHRPASRGERGAVTAQAALNAGLANRLADVEAALAQLEALPPGPRSRVAVGTVVHFEDDGTSRRVAILPGGAGDRLDTPVGSVTVVSGISPLARALAGLEAGDDAVWERRGEEHELEVLSVG
ncbi:MAG: hypothetical protein GY898_10385 [Proteobacteria bacterium]|nr:hypothetical protein [Pseudomonadota bacterium]